MKTTQQLMLLCLMLVLVGSACKGSKAVAWTPVGSWDYVVSDSPAGDVKGVMMIAKDGDNYTGELRTEEGSLDLEDIEIVDKKLTANFSYQGYNLVIESTFMGDMMDGEVSMGYDSFSIKAARQ
ncbi:MAG: hypothetical protein AB8H47_24770 [Bacteroidia bacterium]